MASSTGSQYEQLLEMNKRSLNFNAEPSLCQLCDKLILPRLGIVLVNCLHTFCICCLKISLLRGSTVRCPFPKGRYECVGILEQREIEMLLSPQECTGFMSRQIGALQEATESIQMQLDLLKIASEASVVLNPETFECPICMDTCQAYKEYYCYLERSLKKAELSADNSFHCKTPDCAGWCLVEDNVTVFHCPVCKAQNCVPCEALHAGVTCQAFKDKSAAQTTDRLSQEEIDRMVSTGIAMRCPKCRIALTKIAGCDGIICSVCKTHVCWATRGPRWGPRGPGDTTGGCRCNVNGIRCHVNCQNCH
ncbi:AAEL012112-PA [Aedes aegypti]|uniref:AAEL012112-PA n=1 Tax=Aedes aegypti TaxID=7159 RepID=Q16N10_AEDAE|nr:AAEL012112-PA [Aedes aegypti]